MPFYDYKCPTCLEVIRDVVRRIADRNDCPVCPVCGDKTERHFSLGGGTNIRDEYPGGIVIENLGPEPVKVYSNSERLKIMRERGLEEFVRHTPVPGTDKSPHTSDWSKGSMDPYTLEAAKALVRERKPGENEGDGEQSFDSAIRPFNYVGTGEEARAVRRLINE